MSNKTIQDALAEVQRKVNEERAARVAEMISEVQRGERYNPKTGKYEAPIRKIKPDTSVGKQTLTAEPTPMTTTPKTTTPSTPRTGVPVTGKLMPGASTTGKTLGTIGKIGGAASMAGTGALGAAALGGMASGAIGALATGTETGREIGKKIGQTEIGKTVADVARKAGEAIGVREPSQAKPAETPKPTELPKIDVPAKQTTPAPSQTKKSEPSSFGAAFKAAREKSTEMGKPSTGQFEYKGKEYQTNIKGEKYVPKSQQTKVDTGSSASVPTSGPKTDNVPTPPKRPKDFNPEPEQPAAKRDFNPEPEQPAAKKDYKPEPEQRESGGKKKKMSEDTNPLIAAFFKLQEQNPSNMFEAAKKLTPKQDKHLDVVDDDKLDAKDFAALRAGKKKVEEESVDHLGSSTVTKDKKGYVDPSTPTEPYKKSEPSTAAGDVLSKAKNALDKTGVKEEIEVTFSQAEIDHINSFFLEASVAPNRPEVAAEARPDKVTDGVSQNDVTGTSTESGKKKIKEEAEIINETNKPEVSVYDNAAHVKDKTGKVIASYSMKDYGKDYMKKANAHMSKIKEEVEQIDELDAVKKSYASKALDDIGDRAETIAHARKWGARTDDPAKRSMFAKEIRANRNKINKRKEGIAKAEWSEEVEIDYVQIDELTGKGKLPEIMDKIAAKKKAIQKAANRAEYLYAASNKNDSHKGPDSEKKFYMRQAKDLRQEEVEQIEEGRPKKNPTPETTERDPRKHIQVEAGRAAAGNIIDFHHNDGTKSKITPAMGRRITSHLNSLKPADRQSAVNKMHDSAEGLKV